MEQIIFENGETALRKGGFVLPSRVLFVIFAIKNGHMVVI
jgi:hypothetical protein